MQGVSTRANSRIFVRLNSIVRFIGTVNVASNKPNYLFTDLNPAQRQMTAMKTIEAGAVAAAGGSMQERKTRTGWGSGTVACLKLPTTPDNGFGFHRHDWWCFLNTRFQFDRQEGMS
jgi:hypothetical protein